MVRELSKIEWKIISVLCTKRSLKLKDLAAFAGRSSASVSSKANALSLGGYVNIEPADDERGRPKYVSLTVKGSEMCTKTKEKDSDGSQTKRKK